MTVFIVMLRRNWSSPIEVARTTDYSAASMYGMSLVALLGEDDWLFTIEQEIVE